MTSSSSSYSSAASPTFIAATSSSHNNAGAIAGGLIGGIALVVVVIGAVLLYLRRRNRSKGTLPWSGTGVGRKGIRISSSSGLEGGGGGYGGGAAGRWNRASEDLVGRSFDHPTRHVSALSASTLAGPHRGNSMSSQTHLGSHEGYATEDDEKVPGTPSTLQGHGAPGKQSLDDIPALPLEPPSAYTYGLGRQRSLTSQNRAAALAKLDAAEGTVSRSNSVGTRDTASNPASPTRDNRANRASSSGSGSKRTPRKAVPKYDEGEFAMADMPSPPANVTSLTSPPARAISPSSPPTTYPPAFNRTNSEDGTTNGSRHGSRSGSSANLHSHYLGAELPALNHKTSFGDGPVHYLIPDLPPPQKD